MLYQASHGKKTRKKIIQPTSLLFGPCEISKKFNIFLIAML